MEEKVAVVSVPGKKQAPAPKGIIPLLNFFRLCLSLSLACVLDQIQFSSFGFLWVHCVSECILKEAEEVKKPGAAPSLPAEKPRQPEKGLSSSLWRRVRAAAPRVWS